jgi:hypothetical protein
MRRILVLAAFQTLAILSWASYHEYVWATAPTFRIPLRPRDPFDLVRGRYFVLNPLDSTLDWRSNLFPRTDVQRLASAGRFATSVQVGFCPVDSVYRVYLASLGEKPAGPARFWCRGFARVGSREGWTLDLDLGLHRFFISPEASRAREPGRLELEVSHRPGQSPCLAVSSSRNADRSTLSRRELPSQGILLRRPLTRGAWVITPTRPRGMARSPIGSVYSTRTATCAPVA